MRKIYYNKKIEINPKNKNYLYHYKEYYIFYEINHLNLLYNFITITIPMGIESLTEETINTYLKDFIKEEYELINIENIKPECGSIE